VDKETIEIRWHGRGGQGAVTASKMLAQAALAEGKFFQGMPDYGAERMGAPVKAFTRVSSLPIKLYCQVTEPDIVVVLDPTLLGAIDVTEGLKQDGVLIVNTPKAPEEVRGVTGYKGKTYTVDATAIAMDALGRNLPNTPMLGAVIRTSEVVTKDQLVRTLRKVLGATMKKKVVEGNVTAFEQAFARVQGCGG
jgi:pyruvate ferredoxin oxidoreductase gamma subunit